jgi:hypothetical protein
LWKKIKTYVIGIVVAVVAVYTAGLALGAMGVQGATYSALIANATASQLIASGMVAGFASGVAGGLLSGASLGASIGMGVKGAFFGAIGAGVAYGIGSLGNTIASSWGATAAKATKALLHGLSRAAISRAQGGRYSGGFWSGFASSMLSPLIGSARSFEGKVAMSAIVGGTASELGGGKFANGAVSAAFVMMYNDMSHPRTIQALTPAQQRALFARAQEPGLADVSDLFVPIGRIFAGIGKIFGFGEVSISYRIGANANQEYHAWRHIDELGLPRDEIVKKIETLVTNEADNMLLNRPYNFITNVQGTNIQITMFKLDTGVINVGRMHSVK